MRYRLLSCALFFFGFNALHAQPLVSGIADADYPPFYFADPTTHEIKGVSTEVCQSIAEKLGHSLTFKRLPFARLLHNLEAGNIDMACTLFNTSSRAKGITYTSVPHVFETVWLIHLKNKPISLADLSYKLTNQRIGGIRGYFYGKRISENPATNLLLVQNEEQLVRTLLAGRIDGMLGNRHAISLYAGKEHLNDQIAYHSDPIHHGPVFMAFSRSKKDAHKLASRFTKALVPFMKSEEYTKILEKYQVDTPKF